MSTVARVFVAVLGGLVAIGAVLYLGLKIQPRPFSPYPAQSPELLTLPLPTGLPAPVERYYRTAVGNQIPIIESTVMSGSGQIRIAGITFPSRWRFTHQAGQDYRHYIETTLFGRPVMKVNEHYLDGKVRMALPMGLIENDPKSDLAANLGLWGETMFLPSVYLTDPRVRWEAIDETHAYLVIPNVDEDDRFTVAFDPATGLIQSMEIMRWKEPTSTTKTLWHLEPRAWKPFHDLLLPTEFALIWGDEQGPWFVGTLEEIEYNIDVHEYIRTTGP